MGKDKYVELILKNARATLEVERLKPSEEATNITKSYLYGEISSKQAIERIIKLHLGE